MLPSEHVTSATAVRVPFDACDGSKLAYCCTSHGTSEPGAMFDKVYKKLVCTAGDATGKHYFYGDSVTHELTACTL